MVEDPPKAGVLPVVADLMFPLISLPFASETWTRRFTFTSTVRPVGVVQGEMGSGSVGVERDISRSRRLVSQWSFSSQSI